MPISFGFPSKSKTNTVLVIYFLLLTVYTVFSYSLTAPNLTLISWSPFVQFQAWMWKTFFNNRPLLTQTYLALIIALSTTYIQLFKNWPKTKKFNWQLPILLSLPLLFSNNALSYDVFNYIFNARMVLVYHANPHLKVALDFANDDWTRFMHNTHTPAPYFYGWTGLSLLPYLAGGGKFLATWLSFRLFSWLSLGGLSWILIKNSRQNRWLSMTLLNPLLLIEVVSNSHNDLWMMVPAVFSMLLISKKQDSKTSFFSFILLLFSTSMKLATLALLPLWLTFIFPWKKILPQLQKWLKNNWGFISSVLMFLPLLTPRSKLFLPWYLTWPLIWLPLIDNKWKIWKTSLLILASSVLLRYVPFLWAGNYDGPVYSQQLLITWVPIGIFLLAKIINSSWRSVSTKLQ